VRVLLLPVAILTVQFKIRSSLRAAASARVTAKPLLMIRYFHSGRDKGLDTLLRAPPADTSAEKGPKTDLTATLKILSNESDEAERRDQHRKRRHRRRAHALPEIAKHFEFWWSGTAAMCYRLAVSAMTGTSTHAEEVVQEAFFAGRIKTQPVCFRANFGTWVYRIAANYAIDRMRQKKSEDSNRALPGPRNRGWRGNGFDEHRARRRAFAGTPGAERPACKQMRRALSQLTARRAHCFCYGGAGSESKKTPKL